MGLFRRAERQPSPGELNQASEGSIDAALDKGEGVNKLLEIYQKVHGERLTPQTHEYKFNQLLQIREKINIVSERAKGFLVNEFGQDLGIQFSQEDFEGVTEYLEQEAIKNIETWPPFLEKFEEKLNEYEKLKVQVSEAESILKERTALLTERNGAYDKVKVIGGFKRWTGAFLNDRESQTMAHAKEVGIGKSTVLAEHRLYHEKVEINKSGKSRDVLKKECDILRRTILRTLTADKDVIQKALSAFQERLRNTITEGDKSSLLDLDQAQTTFDKVDRRNSPIDYFEGMEGREKAALKKELNEAIQNKLTYEMKTALETFELGSKQLSRMEKTLGQFLNRDQVGNEKDIHAKVFVLDTLKAIYNKIEKDNPGDVRLTLIERVLIRSKITLKYFKGLSPDKGFVERVDKEPQKDDAPVAAPTDPAQPDSAAPAVADPTAPPVTNDPQVAEPPVQAEPEEIPPPTFKPFSAGTVDSEGGTDQAEAKTGSE